MATRGSVPTPGFKPSFLGLKLAPNKAAAQIAQALPELRAEFARGQDELGLCQTLQLEAAVYWIHGRSAAAEEAWRRAAEYARRANDRRQLTEILGWLASAALWGPTPAAEGIRRCGDYLDEVGNHPRGQAVILKHMAGLYAMQDQFETAHATLSRAKSYLDTLGPTMTAAVTQPAAFIAMLAGDPAAAETHLRFAYESLGQMGEKGNLATAAALLARAIAAQGGKAVRRSQPADRDKPRGRRRRGSGHRDHRPGIVGQDARRRWPPRRSSRTRILGGGPRRADGPAEPARRCPA